MPPAQQLQLVGERLYPRVLPTAPTLASKVVGMFMEMGVDALVELMADDEELAAKVAEAVQVLTVTHDCGCIVGIRRLFCH